jgi:prepilin-type N-terminal cleavage/methylation domain-containing protein
MEMKKATSEKQSRKWTSKSSPSFGYTLNEMLIVMAVLATMAALAWPALRKPLAKHQLRAAAKQLRVELARTRLKAIEQGETLQFRYLPGTGSYRVEPVNTVVSESGLASPGWEDAEYDFDAGYEDGDRLAYDDVSYEEGTDSGESTPSGLTPRPTVDDEDSSEMELPDEVQFAAETAWEDSFEDEFLTASNQPADGDLLETLDSPLLEEWSPPIVFYPNGRTSDATLQLSGDRDYRVRVMLRGITGAITVGHLEVPDRGTEIPLAPVDEVDNATPEARQATRLPQTASPLIR